MFKRRSTLVLIVLSFAAFSPEAGRGAEMTPADVINLFQAGLAPETILEQVRREGMAQPLTTADLLSLRKAGVSASLIDALVRVAIPDSSAAKSAPDDILSRARRLFDQRDLAGVISLVGPHLLKSPGDDRARAVQIAALLASGRREEAEAHLKVLRAATSVEARGFTARLEAVIAKLDSQNRKVGELVAAVQRGDREGALSAVGQLDSSESMKCSLRVRLAMLAADFDGALTTLNEIPPSTWADVAEAPRLRKQIETSRAEFQKAWDEIEWHLYSPWMSQSPFTSVDYSVVIEAHRFSLEKYITSVNTLAIAYPLNPRAADLTFHAALFALPYDNLEALGDKLLHDRGQISIPFMARRTHLNLVVNVASKRLSLDKAGAHFTSIFMKKVKGGWSIPSRWAKNRPDMVLLDANDPTATAGMTDYFEKVYKKGIGEYQSFNFPFSDIVSLSQSADDNCGDDGCWLRANQFALQFKTRSGAVGTAPRYSLMTVLQAVYGLEAQREVTQKLGRFIVHVLNNPRLQAKLTVPGKISAWQIVDIVANGLTAGANAIQGAKSVGSMETAQMLNVMAGEIGKGMQHLESGKQAEVLQWQARAEQLFGGVSFTSDVLDLKDVLDETTKP
ncbi:MAG TPA: hypothetical protein VLB76_17650 [Thermoanaerobaculia bacterium]|jgi:hypothetical protein|nr:hypothetical protein [Thermoanaerobaculia bacterium]